MSKKLILIDLSGLYWANWHATADQELSAAFERTVGRVHSLREGFELCAICCDAPPYNRKKLHPEYKAQRDAPPPQAVEQLQRVKERLAADGLLLWSAPGHEADDVIATACRHAEREQLDVLIASSDKDLYALIDDRFCALLTLNSGQRMNEAACREKFGVSPPLMPELLALMGDTSDNVPGVPGVGVKTAAKLLEVHGPTAEDVIANADDIKTEKLRNAVLGSVDAIRLARQLVQLSSEAPIKWEELYEERKPQPLSGGQQDWTDAEFTEEPVSDVAAKKPEPEPEAKDVDARLPSDGPQPPDEQRAKPITTLARAPAEWSLALEPPSARDAWVVARKLHDSRMFGNFGSAEAIFAIVLRGRALGLDAGTALASFHVVEGKPTMHAGLIIGLVLKSGKAEYFDLVETSHERATWATKRKGARHETKLTWTIEDACAATLVEKTASGFRGVSRSGKPSNWDKYRRTMLRWRAGVELARAVYPDVTMGLYTPDEVSDGQATLIDGELEVA